MVMFLLKYFKQRSHADAFVAGRLFLNTVTYFKGVDQSDGRGDPHEGPVSWLQPAGLKITIGGHTILSEDLAAPVVVQDTVDDATNLLCLYAGRALERGTLAEIREHARVPEQCKDLGPWVVLVHDSKSFFERFDAAIRRDGHGLVRGPVSYFDGDTHSGSFERSLFSKKKSYSWQREYRCAVNARRPTSSALHLDIGDLSDICVIFESSALGDPDVVPINS